MKHGLRFGRKAGRFLPSGIRIRMNVSSCLCHKTICRSWIYFVVLTRHTVFYDWPSDLHSQGEVQHFGEVDFLAQS